MAREFRCEDCGSTFSRKWTLHRHRQRLHSGLPEYFPCEYCHQVFRSKEHFTEHIKSHKPTKVFSQQSHALGIVSIWTRQFKNCASLDYPFTNRKNVIEVLQHELLQKNVIKASIDLLCTFTKAGPNGEDVDKTTITLHSKFYTLFRMQTFTKFINQCKVDIFKRLDDLTLRGSNWSLRAVHKMNVSIGKVKDLLGGCENGTLINPSKLKRGQYIRNPPSVNDECFYACIAYHFTKSAESSILQKFISQEITKINTGAMSINQIAKFEKANEALSIAINVVNYMSDGEMYPLYSSKNRNAVHRISLVLYFSSELNEMGHYMYITDFNKYASYHYKTKSNTVNYIPGFYCHNCLLHFKRESAFQKHIVLCNENATQKIILPKKDSFLEFKSYRKTYPLPLIGFCDFEAGMHPTEFCSICNDARKCPHNTNFLNQHEAFAFSLMIFDRNNKLVLRHTYAGRDCVKRLLEYLLEHEEMLCDLFHTNLPINATKKELEGYKKSKMCGICGHVIEKDEVDAMHHEHYTGKMISRAHRDCNINARLTEELVPIFFHNLAGYDIHFIVKAMNELRKGAITKLDIMPHNTEKIRKLDLNIYSFMDSMDFLSGSLADITRDLVMSKHDFPLLKEAKIYETEEQKALLLRKGVFPYGFVQDHMQLLAMKEVPAKEAFFSDITQTDISETDYKHALQVFSVMKCQDMLDYMFIYVNLDVLLLAEAFVKFRNVIFDEERLDVAQFLSTPHASFHLMLKITQVQLDYLTDIEMVNFLDRNIRGGMSFINIRHAKRDPEKNIDLAYWDCNNLYGHSQSQLLPTDQYRWLTKKEIEEIEWSTVDTNGETGMICEVDLDYPPHLHAVHNSFILAPEKRRITYDDLSPHSRNVYAALNNDKRKYSAEKLTATFEPRKNYVVHMSNLQFYLKHGLILRKVHRVLAFRQTYFLKSFIDFCTKKRTASSSKFSKDLWKLIANACYGKFLQQDKNRILMDLCLDEATAAKLIASPLFTGFRVINSETIAVFRRQMSTKLNKFYAVGFSILEASKLHMYRSYYEWIQPYFGPGNVELLMSDTDSFALRIKTTNLRRDMKNLSHFFDFSNYPPDDSLYNTERKSQVGFFKDELEGQIFEEFCGLRSKAYSMVVRNRSGEKEVKSRCKGITKTYRQRIRFEAYLACINSTAKIRTQMRSIRAKNNVLRILHMNKTAVSSFDDKRYMLRCSIHTVGYGSVQIHRGNNWCAYCPNADIFYTSQQFEKVHDYK